MITLLALSAFASTPARVEAARDALDWDAVESEAAQWLSDYIQIDTTAPPGNERDGAVFLQEHLRREGFQTRLVDHGDNRASLIARLSSGHDAAPLCLLSHIDVVPAEPERWSRPPLSGAIDDGFVWGRGAIDMKGMGVMEMSAAIQIARLGLPLNRDVVVLAVADEEVGGMGIQELVKDHWDTIGCGHVINEGGLGVEDALFDGQTVHAISVAERGVLWARLVAEGAPGHGSTIEPGEAPAQLLEAMQKIDDRYEPKPVLVPAMVEMLERVGEHKGGFTGAILKSGVGRGLLVKPKLAKQSTTASLVTTTVHLTGMSGASSTNVVPSTVWASYDCRLLPGIEPEAFLEELKGLTADVAGVHWETLLTMTSNSSPWDDPLFERLAHYAVEGDPNAVAAPVLSPGFTDSIYVRPTGARAYGYIPVAITAEDRNAMHGDDERISLENLRRGVRTLFSVVVDVAGADAHPVEVQVLLDELGALPLGTDPSSIADELAARVAIDQRLRRQVKPGEPDPALLLRMGLVDLHNTRRMRSLVAAEGWPTVSVYGAKASKNAWLLVQHADHDPAFQAEMLGKMEPLVATEEASGKDYAYLVDRVAGATGSLQQFGTQGACDREASPPIWRPHPVDEPDQLAARREAVGLVDLETYTGWFDCEGLEPKGREAYEAKDWRRCVEHYTTFAERSTRGGPALFNAACCSALAGDRDRAFQLLERAVGQGMTRESAQVDPDLSTLRGDPRWDALRWDAP